MWKQRNREECYYTLTFFIIAIEIISIHIFELERRNNAGDLFQCLNGVRKQKRTTSIDEERDAKENKNNRWNKTGLTIGKWKEFWKDALADNVLRYQRNWV